MYILDLFMRNLILRPRAPFLYDDMHESGLSYAQFENMTARIYGWLNRQGIGREDFVLVNLPRGVMPLVGAVAVWKAGAAFVIVEENYAPERVEAIRKDCGCKAELNMDNIREILQTPPKRGFVRPNPHDAAFAVYTSGTSGKPKGVLHEYGNIDRCIRSLKMEGNPMLKRGNFRPFNSPLSFVAAVIGLIGILATERARMYVVSYKTAKNPAELKRLFERYRFNLVFLSPSYARMIIPQIRGSLRTLVVGSENANGLYFEGLDIRNFYAASESLFVIASFRIDRPYEVTPVGKPAFPLKLRVVDENGKDVKPGETGEIIYDTPYFRGYIHREEENAKALRDGFFHTGDLGRMDENGNLYITGRMNEMIKINGNRVEPGEIETVIKKVLGIDWCAVRCFTDGAGNASITAYYTAEIGIDSSKLRKELLEYLPYYMIPTRYMHLDEIPLLPNGKLNRKGLPEPKSESFRKPYRAPENETERILCEAFEKLLDIDRIGTEDDFYELGGDSLRSIRLILDTGLSELTVGDVFRGRTPRAIAKIYLEERKTREGISPEERNRLSMQRAHPLTTEQLYMFDVQLFVPKSTMYNLFMMTGVQKGIMEAERLAEVVEKAVAAHPSLRTTLSVNEDGDIVQRYTPELFAPIRPEKVTEAEFETIKQSLVQPYKLMNAPLNRFRIFETETFLYFFMDVHHILFDGSSFRVLLKDIETIYRGGEPQKDYYYLMLDQREEDRKTPFYEECRRYYEEEYEEIAWDCCPKMDRESDENSYGEIRMAIPATGKEVEKVERIGKISRNEFFIAAATVATAVYNGSRDIMHSWIYNGREDLMHRGSTGLYFRDLPVGLRLGEIGDLQELYDRTGEQVQGAIAHSCYSYIEQNSSLESGEMACVLYQRAIRDKVENENAMLKSIELPWNNAASQTLLDIQILDGKEGLQVVLDYNSAIYEEKSMARYADILIRTVRAMIDGTREDGTDDLEEMIRRLEAGE